MERRSGGLVAAAVTVVATMVAGVPAPAGAGAQPGPATGPPVTVTELPAREGWDLTPFALDERGRVVATAVLANGSIQYRQVRLYQDGGWVEVSPPASRLIQWSEAHAVNERGDVVGTTVRADGYPPELPQHGATIQPFAWLDGRLADFGDAGPGTPVASATGVDDVNDRRQVLLRDRVWQDGRVTVAPALTPAPAAGSRTSFVALNNAGQAVGTVWSPRPGDPLEDETEEPVLWRIGGRVTRLGPLPPYQRSRAQAINDAGVVVGSGSAVLDHAGTTRSGVWVWRRGRMTDVGTLGGDHTQIITRNGRVPSPTARGEVVGQSQTESGEFHAFYWRGGRMLDLGTPGERSWAVDVNDRGQVIAEGQTESRAHAFLWQDGRRLDLSALVAGEGRRFEVYDINNRGQILGRLWEPGVRGSSRIVICTVPPSWSSQG